MSGLQEVIISEPEDQRTWKCFSDIVLINKLYWLMKQTTVLHRLHTLSGVRFGFRVTVTYGCVNVSD